MGSLIVEGQGLPSAMRMCQGFKHERRDDVIRAQSSIQKSFENMGADYPPLGIYQDKEEADQTFVSRHRDRSISLDTNANMRGALFFFTDC